MFPGLRLWTFTIRTPAQAVKSGVENQNRKELRGRRVNSQLRILLLFDFSMDQSLNDRSQKFPGDDVNDLRAHLIENSLNHGLYKRRIRHTGRCQLEHDLRETIHRARRADTLAERRNVIQQIGQLSSYNRILHSPLTTIETNGGGSAR